MGPYTTQRKGHAITGDMSRKCTLCITKRRKVTFLAHIGGHVLLTSNFCLIYQSAVKYRGCTIIKIHNTRK
jgi:hypothetical protein